MYAPPLGPGLPTHYTDIAAKSTHPWGLASLFITVEFHLAVHLLGARPTDPPQGFCSMTAITLKLKYVTNCLKLADKPIQYLPYDTGDSMKPTTAHPPSYQYENYAGKN